MRNQGRSRKAHVKLFRAKRALLVWRFDVCNLDHTSVIVEGDEVEVLQRLIETLYLWWSLLSSFFVALHL